MLSGFRQGDRGRQTGGARRFAFYATSPQADGKTYNASTFTDDNGEFHLTTFSAGDGAPAGGYTVTILVNWVSKDGQDVPVKDLLKGQYSDAKTSTLKATVRAGTERPSAVRIQNKRTQFTQTISPANRSSRNELPDVASRCHRAWRWAISGRECERRAAGA